MKKYKNLMCTNIIKSGSCRYKDQCLYAHNIHEQTLTPIRKLLYEIIDNNKTINTVAWIENNILKELIILTKKCEIGECVGGNNCNLGVHNIKYLVCSDNLLSECINNDCNLYHIRPSKKTLKDINNVLNMNNKKNKKFKINELEYLMDSSDEETDIYKTIFD